MTTEYCVDTLAADGGYYCLLFAMGQVDPIYRTGVHPDAGDAQRELEQAIKLIRAGRSAVAADARLREEFRRKTEKPLNTDCTALPFEAAEAACAVEIPAPDEYGELPGDICCQRAGGGRCYEHDPAHYPQSSPE